MQETLHATHLLKLLDKMYKYEMDPSRTVAATERTRDAGRTDGLTDRQSETNIPLTSSLCGGIMMTEINSRLPANQEPGASVTNAKMLLTKSF